MDRLRFDCLTGCTNCCRQQGYVYITEGDLKRAAAFVGLSRKAFEAKYVCRTTHSLRFRKPPRAPCHFLEEDGCAIHPVKPAQCRLFPFWPELVGSRKAWRETASYCPGIGRGRLIGIGTALRVANQMREAYPGTYGEKGAREPFPPGGKGV